MKRLLFTLILTFTAVMAWSQVPNEEDILRKTMDNRSPYYYTSLMMRYNNLEQLSIEDYHYLYYGFTYQEDYRPTASNNALDELYVLLPHINVNSSDRKDLENLIFTCKDVLRLDPFNLTALNMMVFAYGAMGDKTTERAYYRHLHGIMETIKASGDGRSEKYPMHIIMFSHAIDLLSSMGMAAKRGEIISRDVEYVPLLAPHKTPDGKKIRGLYFDYSRIYRNKTDDVTFEKKRTWQFNGLKPKEYK